MEAPTSGLPRGEHQRNARAQRLGQRQTLCNRLPASSEPSVAITTFLYMAQVLETLHYEPALPFVGVRRAEGRCESPTMPMRRGRGPEPEATLPPLRNSSMIR